MFHAEEHYSFSTKNVEWRQVSKSLSHFDVTVVSVCLSRGVRKRILDDQNCSNCSTSIA